MIQGKLIDDCYEYRILRMNVEVKQKLGINNIPVCDPDHIKYHLEVESDRHPHFLYCISQTVRRDLIQLKFESPRLGEKGRVFNLYDCIVPKFEEVYGHTTGEPLKMKLTLVAGMSYLNGEFMERLEWCRFNKDLIDKDPMVFTRERAEEVMSGRYVAPVATTSETEQLLVKKVEGPFAADGRKAQELIMGNTYLYKVTEYNNGEGDKLNNTHWSVELNNSGQLSRLDKSNAFIDKGTICYKYTPEKAENIRIYAWCNEATEDVSVEVPVVCFPFCVDRVNVPGLNRDLSDIADDLAYGYGKVTSRPIYSSALINQYKSEYINSGFDFEGKHSLFANTENDNYPVKAIYSEKQMADTEVKLFGKDWMEWYDSGDDIMKYKSKEKYPDEKLFEIFKDKAKFWFAEGQLDGNIERMIDKFQENSGGVYEDHALSNALINSPNMELYCNNVQDYIAQRLKERKGLISKNINGVNPIKDDTIYMVLEPNSRKARRDIGKITTIPRKDGNGNTFFFRPIFGSKDDRTKGTQIATNDIWSTEVKITNITFTGEDYTINYHVNLWDHFGLDIGDMEAMPNIVPFAKDTFAVWFVLQHLRGYKPFITKVQFSRSFTGNINKGMKDRVNERQSKKQ